MFYSPAPKPEGRLKGQRRLAAATRSACQDASPHHRAFLHPARPSPQNRLERFLPELIPESGRQHPRITVRPFLVGLFDPAFCVAFAYTYLYAFASPSCLVLGIQVMGLVNMGGCVPGAGVHHRLLWMAKRQQQQQREREVDPYYTRCSVHPQPYLLRCCW